MHSVISAVVISPDSLFTYGLVHLLRTANYYRLAGVAPSPKEFHISPGEHEPEIVILVLEDDEANLAAITHVRGQLKTAKIVVLGDCINPVTCAEVIRAGADAYLSRSISKDAFVQWLDLVVAGEVVISSALLAPKLDEGVDTMAGRDGGVHSFDEPVSRLSPREAEILECIVDGASNKQISRRFDITEATVKVHVKSILRKINAHNRTQAAIWALYHGMRQSISAIST
ncbi:LuxR C-terminal-related transcriptional regulator [Bradyrhizobium erythrophlei]|jgi:two-component system nitrate/nitrite response regulator NarL|uniref:Two-component system, NarL family, nitrate/nitrite response regulator NarL n=1 Tax=Bradyrhizobium erythrophlei TaxID=1437360 RepID=A0A1M5JR73_9BRAD|nr:response regulator transcription factor [Bradyrhizobium erythrophlei]SHG43057.1 two-component system, NarL family, nitrate/nitrite response regulator NarL [Bradyrhizobium erythrophlei]